MIPGGLVATLLLSTEAASIPVGQEEFVSVGTFDFVVPADVVRVHAVCIGAGATGSGALSFSNNISVTPGETLTVVVPDFDTGTSCSISRGATALVRATSAVDNIGGTIAEGVGSSRLQGANSGAALINPPLFEGDTDSYYYTGGGAGTAGYTHPGTHGSAASIGIYPSRVGGGVGVKGGTIGGGNGYGRDSSPTLAGAANSGGVGVQFGAGGTASKDAGTADPYPPPNLGGGHGAARIMWGAGRLYPNTNTGDL